MKYGDCNQDVVAALKKFNEINRKDGLRDICEIVERETEDLALIGVRKNLLNKSEATIKSMNWSSQINMLASVTSYQPSHSPIIEDAFKNDLHSFRGARNLVDHKVSTKREDKRRELQFAERMMQGPRIVAELVRLKRKTR